MKRDPELGLSYVEMLVALALLAIMASLIAGTMQTGRTVWERTDGLGAQAEEALLRREVRTWLGWITWQDHPDLPRYFEGRSDGFAYRGGVARNS